MDMGKKGTVTANGVSYRYVLSVLDVFSRFGWPRALSDKCIKTIANELKSIYLEHGPPKLVIQSDQGREFKGTVKRLCRDMTVKTIYSRPYHPQSQGKVERSHRALREKMTYNFLRMSKKGELDERTPNLPTSSERETKRGFKMQICFPSVLCAKACFQQN